MFATTDLFICFALVLLVSNTSKAHSFCVHSEYGNDSNACLRNGQNCCQSLQFLLENLTAMASVNNILINILQDITLDSILWIRNFENLTIQSKEPFKIIGEVSSNDSTGIYFENVTGLALVNLTIENCGMLQKSSTLSEGNSNYELTWCAVYVINSTNLTIKDISISHSRGTGLLIYDTNGSVEITDSLFDNNINAEAALTTQDHPGGGGLKIEFTYNHKGIANSTYIIENCRFINNYNFELKPKSSVFKYYHDTVYQGHGRGGGLFIAMRGNSNGNRVNIINCLFLNNSASTWGGGAYVSLRDFPEKNDITFTGCNFENNKCKNFGGGGLGVSLLSYQGVAVSNRLLFDNCNFTSNYAKLNGGGIALVVTRENKFENHSTQLSNNIYFQDCTWLKNEADWGSAVDITPAFWDILGNGLLPEPCFLRCTFMGNRVTISKHEVHPGIVVSTRGVGTLVISNFIIHIAGYLNFIDNDGTALYLQSALVHVGSGTDISFVRNKATSGGAVALNFFSVLYMSTDIHIVFVNNTAKIEGGAVYAISNDRQERYSSRSCFIQTEDRNLENNNITIIFTGNTAETGRGNSIYASSLNPCGNPFFNNSGDSNMDGGNKVFNIIGLIEKDTTTSYYRFKYEQRNNSDNLQQLIPGQFFKIAVNAYDELNNPTSVTYNTVLENNLTSLDVASYVSNTKIRLKSQGGVNHNQIHLVSGHTTLSIDVTVIACPPGHTINDKVCICDISHFKGIWKCNNARKIASIINGYWIGLCNGNMQCTGHCPVGFCTNSISTDLQNVLLSETHTLLCINNREGKLCSRCSANHSVYYHSHDFKCGEESLCKLGILFYIASEILPLTIIFVMVIMLNVSFTSGTVNGVILYAQIFDSFISNFHNTIHFPKLVNILIDGYRVVYTVSNLNYFSIDQLSFCLWKGATTLDVIAWKYVTIVYALCLILVTVFLLNTTICKKLCVCWRPHTVKNAAIHGLVAFLTMCFSQCAKICFLLLTRVSLGRSKGTLENVVYMSGENRFFDEVHIKYGIPALFFTLVIVILPPMLLFLYPLSFKILALCKLSELRILNRISNFFPVQLFDAFQSCYKDEFRFFSGLYFFYRVVPLILYAVNTDLILYYFSVEIFLIVALALNATLQPYKNRWHNITDTLIFTNLAIINMISLYNYQKINEGKDSLNSVKLALTITTVFQLLFIYLPLFYIIILFSWKLGKWVTKKAIERKISKLDKSQESLLDSMYLPPLRERYSIRDSTAEFVEMN